MVSRSCQKFLATNTTLIGVSFFRRERSGPWADDGASGGTEVRNGPYGRIKPRMDPSRKRAIRLTVALTAALLLATALIYTSFTAGRDELTASRLLISAKPGQSYILAGTVMTGWRRDGDALLFRVRDPKLKQSALVRYTGIVPDPFASGRGVLVTVHKQGSQFIGEQNSLSTKCPSKYQATKASY
jgi:cytochrome c-type biogenesis protein CcmE